MLIERGLIISVLICVACSALAVLGDATGRNIAGLASGSVGPAALTASATPGIGSRNLAGVLSMLGDWGRPGARIGDKAVNIAHQSERVVGGLEELGAIAKAGQQLPPNSEFTISMPYHDTVSRHFPRPSTTTTIKTEADRFGQAAGTLRIGTTQNDGYWHNVPNTPTTVQVLVDYLRREQLPRARAARALYFESADRSASVVTTVNQVIRRENVGVGLRRSEYFNGKGELTHGTIQPIEGLEGTLRDLSPDWLRTVFADGIAATPRLGPTPLNERLSEQTIRALSRLDPAWVEWDGEGRLFVHLTRDPETETIMLSPEGRYSIVTTNERAYSPNTSVDDPIRILDLD